MIQLQTPTMFKSHTIIQNGQDFSYSRRNAAMGKHHKQIFVSRNRGNKNSQL